MTGQELLTRIDEKLLLASRGGVARLNQTECTFLRGLLLQLLQDREMEPLDEEREAQPVEAGVRSEE
jgi:hypothetical protein